VDNEAVAIDGDEGARQRPPQATASGVFTLGRDRREQRLQLAELDRSFVAYGREGSAEEAQAHLAGQA